MNDERLSRLENQVRCLEQTVKHLNERIAGLDDAAGLPSVLSVGNNDIPADATSFPSLSPNLTASGFMFMLGRAILFLAGGFLLRVMTESGSIPPVVGFASGTVYSLGLVFFTYRTLGRGDHLGAAGIGLTAALIAYPFFIESITQLHLVSAVPGGLALTVVTAAGLGTAWWCRHRFLAWVFCMAAMATVVVLGFTAGAPEFFALLLLVLGAATTLLAYTRRWHLKRWVVAIAANVVFFRLTIIAANPEGVGSGNNDVSTTLMLALDLALLGVYLGFFCYRALIQGRGVRVFDVVQSAFALAVGFGGATHVARATGQGVGALGWGALVAALTYYTISFTTVRSRLGRGRGFFYFASLALVFLVLGSHEVAQGSWLSWIWLILGLLMTVLGSGFERVTLRIHGVIYLALASIQTGFMASVLDAFVGAAPSSWDPLGVSGAVNIVVAVVCYTVLVTRSGHQTDSRARRAPAVSTAVLALMGLAYWAIVLATKAVSASDPAVVAVIRTAVISTLAVVLALLCRQARLRELAWLVYPLLGVGCLKLLVEDLRQGNPTTLFIAFGFLGAALILAPRLVSGGRRSD